MRAMMLVFGLMLAGCGVEANAFGVSDERFIETMVELRRAAAEAGADTVRFELLRRDVLEAQGITEEDLRAYVEANGGDLDHMAAVWDSIAARLADPVPE